MHPHDHAIRSVELYGGVPTDYLKYHEWMDASKEAFADWRHRMLRHHSQGIFEGERVFGAVCRRESDGGRILVRYILEQHVRDDCGGFIPSFSDWARNITRQPWMAATGDRLRSRGELPTPGPRLFYTHHDSVFAACDPDVDTSENNQQGHCDGPEEVKPMETTVFSRAAGVLIENDRGLVLGFVRSDRHSAGVALPCGGVDPGESDEDAAKRECLEETGYTVELYPHPFRSVERRDNVTTTIYRAKIVGARRPPTHAHEGEPQWVPREALLRGPYSAYNAEMLAHFDGIKHI